MRFLFVLFIITTFYGNAQSSYQVGSINTIVLSKSLKNEWKLNLKSETRTLFSSGLLKEKQPVQLDYKFSNAALLATKKVGLSDQIAIGFQMRFADKTEKRFTQQYNIVTDYYSFKIAHRFTTDQTFVPEEDTNYRVRYRLTFSKPFSGNELNPKEWYFRIGNEYVNSFKGEIYDLEVRLTPAIGYNFINKSKIELALEYRTNGFLNLNNRHRGFAVVNYYLAI